MKDRSILRKVFYGFIALFVQHLHFHRKIFEISFIEVDQHIFVSKVKVKNNPLILFLMFESNICCYQQKIVQISKVIIDKNEIALENVTFKYSVHFIRCIRLPSAFSIRSNSSSVVLSKLLYCDFISCNLSKGNKI